MNKRFLTYRQKEGLAGYIFVLPFIIGFIVLTGGPLAFSFIASFTDYNVASDMEFVGINNYRQLFTADQLFMTALWNTTYFVLFSVPLTTLGALFLAALLNQDVPGMRFFRTIYYLPAVLSGVGVYLLWMQLLDPTTGLINVALGWIGIDGPNWLFDPDWTKPSLILMKMWSVGGSMLLYLASMQGISKSLYEAAEIDGASGWKKFFYITVPMVTPIIFFDLVTSTIGAFQIFQEAYVMTSNGEGGVANSLLFYNLYLWNKAFEAFDMGYAMAMSWVLFVIVFIITIFNLKLAPRWVHYEGGDDK
ncbi:carbohydrate ABC transporter permease [Planococcus lenghuensis]|uniref:Spermidine/putrescine ABC transporter permease n=1 Tax=Planococcus lenghuensis TaxID=2213202 RepID=A0A1Q2KV81_9BACL|nr:sugar ABC transporter permease [Planococcus lenghuensis]AQQ52128.1 spermidine/putrescine ABC transporter permease [Planococcus lenghuensis]